MLTTLLMRLSLLNSRGAVEATPTTALLEDTRAGLCIVMAALQGLWTAILAKQMRPDLDRTQLESRLAFQPFGGHDSALIGRLFLGDSKRKTRVSSFLALHSSSCRFISGTSTS